MDFTPLVIIAQEHKLQKRIFVMLSMTKPDILFLDEAFSALDYSTRLNVSDDVKEQIFVSDMKQNDYELLYKSPNAIGTKVTKDSPLIINTENESDTLILQVELLPIHPTNNSDVSFSIGLEGGKYQRIEYHTKGRSEEWKNNVLYNKSVREITLIRDNQRTPYNVIIMSEHEGVYVQTVKKRISLCER